MRHTLPSLLIVSAVTLLFGADASTQEHGTHVQELFVVQNSDFTTQHPGGVWSFDLSPDGKTLAVEFGTHVPDVGRKYGKFGIWVALWSVDTGRLVAAQEIEDDLPLYIIGQYNKGLPFAWYEHKLRFSGDGRALIVLTGPRLVALSFPELAPMWTLEDPVDLDSDKAQMVFTNFSVSVQAGRVAVLRQYVKGDVKTIVGPYSFEVLTADLRDGKLLGRWSKAGHSESIALSPDGSLLALALTMSERQLSRDGLVPIGQSNVLVLNADSGEVVRAFNTGPLAGDAQFLASAKRLVTVPYDHGSSDPQWYLNGTVKLWNLETGQLDRELSYPKYGVRNSSEMALSADGSWLAVADPWHNSADIKSDRDVTRGWVRLLVWHIPTGRLVYESNDLGANFELQSGLPGLFGRPVLVRVSGSGNRLAIGGELIAVYSIDDEQREIAQGVPVKLQ